MQFYWQSLSLSLHDRNQLITLERRRLMQTIDTCVDAKHDFLSILFLSQIEFV